MDSKNLTMNDLEEIFKKIIEKKYVESGFEKENNEKFSKIKPFEANAIGGIGEEFIKEILSKLTKILDEGTIHNEYDVCTESGVRFEIKTARKGKTNNTFQFNGINPQYNYNYLICIGICFDKIVYRIFEKNNISYKHEKENRGYVIEQKKDEYNNNSINKKLVSMNPGNQVNFKLTLNISEMSDLQNFYVNLKSILKI